MDSDGPGRQGSAPGLSPRKGALLCQTDVTDGQDGSSRSGPALCAGSAAATACQCPSPPGPGVRAARWDRSDQAKPRWAGRSF